MQTRFVCRDRSRGLHVPLTTGSLAAEGPSAEFSIDPYLVNCETGCSAVLALPCEVYCLLSPPSWCSEPCGSCFPAARFGHDSSLHAGNDRFDRLGDRLCSLLDPRSIHAFYHYADECLRASCANS